MKEFLTLIRLLSPRNLLHFFLLLKKEPQRYIFANINQKVQSLRTPYHFISADGDKKELTLIANGFVRDEFYKIKGTLKHNIDQIYVSDSSGTLKESIISHRTDHGFSFDALIKVDKKLKQEKLFLNLKDGNNTKKIKLSKFNLSAKRNCNKTEVYRMKVDEEQHRLSSNINTSRVNEEILFSFILENGIEKWDLKNTIASLDAQLYKNWELIVPLTQDNKDIAEQLENEKVRFIDSEGIYRTEARNVLLKECKGMYIGFIQDNDLLHQNCLSQIYHSVSNHKNINLVYVDSDLIDENNQRRFPKYRPAVSIDHLRCMNYIGSFYLFSKIVSEQLNGYNSKLNLSSSHYDFILRIIDLDSEKNSIEHID